MKAKTPQIINKHGIVGESALWDGPLDVDGFPMGKGSSSGKDGLELSKADCKYSAGPITNKAMGKGKMIR
jgi:hypothetical protein